MRVLFYSIHSFEKKYIRNANNNSIDIHFTSKNLGTKTAKIAAHYDAISIFTSDDASEDVLKRLFNLGIKYIAIRSAGYDNINIKAAQNLGIKVANVPKYSPYAIAEHSIGLMLALNRKINLAEKQVSRFNFKIDNLIGFDMRGKTVGVIGTGNIGSVIVKILHGFDCKIICYDINQNDTLKTKYGVSYTNLETLCKYSDIISIHIPLNESTRYLINEKKLKIMKKKVMIINTSRGAIVNTADIIKYLKLRKIGYYGADVYENEKNTFFKDLSKNKSKDHQIIELMSFTNVLITPHQAFATEEALTNIATTNINNLERWKKNGSCKNEIKPDQNTKNKN